MLYSNCRDFLKDTKQLISKGKKDFIKRTYEDSSGRRVKWIEALFNIGLTAEHQIWDEILDLVPPDLHEGPCIDQDRPGEGKVIWIFKKNINGVQTYIKLKIDQRRGCVCLSFHEDW